MTERVIGQAVGNHYCGLLKAVGLGHFRYVGEWAGRELHGERGWNRCVAVFDFRDDYQEGMSFNRLWANLPKLKEMYPGWEFNVCGDSSVMEGELQIFNGSWPYGIIENEDNEMMIPIKASQMGADAANHWLNQYRTELGNDVFSDEYIFWYDGDRYLDFGTQEALAFREKLTIHDDYDGDCWWTFKGGEHTNMKELYRIIKDCLSSVPVGDEYIFFTDLRYNGEDGGGFSGATFSTK